MKFGGQMLNHVKKKQQISL